MTVKLIMSYFANANGTDLGSSDPFIRIQVEVSQALNDFVSQHMMSFKCSTHDVAHAFRVANLAQRIAIAEGANQKISFLSGLLHDIMDSKLNTFPASTEEEIRALLTEDPSLTAEDVESIMGITKSIGYKNLIKEGWSTADRSVEYKCVQDADLLDAIGAVGVARCFGYGGKKVRPMFSLSGPCELGISHADYMAQQSAGEGGSSTVQHFFDKLLCLRSLMITETGKHIAACRHEFLEQFLGQLQLELSEGGDPSSEVISNYLQLCPQQYSESV